MLKAILVGQNFFSKEQASFNFVTAVTNCSDFGVQENKVFHCFCCFLIYLSWSDRTRYHDLHFWMLSFKPAFSLSSFIFIKRHFSSSSLCHKTGVICISEVIDISPGNLDSSLCFIQVGISHDVLCISYISRVTVYSLDVLLSSTSNKCTLLSPRHQRLCVWDTERFASFIFELSTLEILQALNKCL